MKTFFAKVARPATALALAAGLALSPVSARPAAAQGEELLIAGAIGALFLGAIAAGAQTSAGASVTVGTPGYYPHHPRPSKPYTPAPTYNPRKVLPAGCSIPVGRGANSGVYYGKVCLDRNFRGARNLPSNCRTTMVTKGSGYTRTVYSGACLQRYGYTPTVARR